MNRPSLTAGRLFFDACTAQDQYSMEDCMNAEGLRWRLTTTLNSTSRSCHTLPELQGSILSLEKQKKRCQQKLWNIKWRLRKAYSHAAKFYDKANKDRNFLHKPVSLLLDCIHTGTLAACHSMKLWHHCNSAPSTSSANRTLYSTCKEQESDTLDLHDDAVDGPSSLEECASPSFIRKHPWKDLLVEV